MRAGRVTRVAEKKREFSIIAGEKPPRSQTLLGTARPRSSASHPLQRHAFFLRFRPAKQSFAALRSQAELGTEAFFSPATSLESLRYDRSSGRLRPVADKRCRMDSFPRASLIVSTYNWPQALELCLSSILHQTVLPTEVVIADDGSTKDTRDLVETLQSKLPVPVTHTWQPDRGFQRCRILNKAIAAATGDYLIQVDGDVILHPLFIRDHMHTARPGHFVCGNRAWLDEAFTLRVLQRKQLQFSLFEKGLHNKFNAVHLPALAPFIPDLFKKERGLANLRGCNMSFWKKDIMAINGYNEALGGWGREDTELVVRLYNAGLRCLHLTLKGIVYHLYHKECDRSRLAANDAIVQEAIDKKIVSCASGIRQVASFRG